MADQLLTERRGILTSPLFRYSLRTLLLVMTLVAIACGHDLVIKCSKQDGRRLLSGKSRHWRFAPTTIQRDGVFYSGGVYRNRSLSGCTAYWGRRTSSTFPTLNCKIRLSPQMIFVR